MILTQIYVTINVYVLLIVDMSKTPTTVVLILIWKRLRMVEWTFLAISTCLSLPDANDLDFGDKTMALYQIESIFKHTDKHRQYLRDQNVSISHYPHH